MCSTLKTITTESIKCDGCAGVIETGAEILIDLHLIDGAFFFCSDSCADSIHGEQLTDEQIRRCELLEDLGTWVLIGARRVSPGYKKRVP